MKIFDLYDESSSFKEMYFKVFRAPKTQPFFLNSKKKARFHLYWRLGYRSPRPGLMSFLRMVWGKEHLAIKNLMCDDETAKEVAVHRRNVQRENAGAPSRRSLLSEKEKSNKSLGSRVTELEAKMKPKKTRLEKMKEEAEALAMNRLTENEENVLGQLRMLAPGIDFFKVSAYNKVVDGQIVEFPVNELPEVPSPEVLK
ncbi:hypothetical protein PIB30_030299 [Stylosanthes scabra]|uniref:Uncharacterized protein n=1 Tax=Stylosanthes scabra TaxID=79078 RepID=A0ABU6RCA6_9FABA|nr:hypothetical protein [Stylosanthes scabra]